MSREQNRFNQLVVSVIGEINRRLDDCFANISAIGTGSTVETDKSMSGDGSPGDPLTIILYNTTVTSGGTLTLDVNSKTTQVFTGSNSHTVQLPVTSTLVLGRQFIIVNQSTQEVDANSSGGNQVARVVPGQTLILICVKVTGTGVDSWSASTALWATDAFSLINGAVNSLHYHPHPVFGKFDAAGNILYSSGISSITDTGTGEVKVTFSSAYVNANYYSVSVDVEMTATTYAVANDRKAKIKNGGQLTGSVALICIDSTAVTNLVKDPTSWHFGVFSYK